MMDLVPLNSSLRLKSQNLDGLRPLTILAGKDLDNRVNWLSSMYLDYLVYSVRDVSLNIIEKPSPMVIG